MKQNSHAPEILTHITEEHAKPNVFHGEPGAKHSPMVEKGCYANSGKPSKQKKM